MAEEEFSVYYLRDARWIYNDVIGEICWCYTVRWSPPYTEDDNTLEPEDNLSCDELLDRFWDQFGGRSAKITRRKHVLTSSERWIEKEKRLWRRDNPDAPPTPGPASSKRELSDKETEEKLRGLFSSPSPPHGPSSPSVTKRKRSKDDDTLDTGASQANAPTKNKHKKPKLGGGSRDSTPLSQHSNGSRKGKDKAKGKGKAKATEDSNSRGSTPLLPASATNDGSSGKGKGKDVAPVPVDQGDQASTSKPRPFIKISRIKLVPPKEPAPPPPDTSSPRASTASSPDNMPLSMFPDIISPSNAFNLDGLLKSNNALSLNFQTADDQPRDQPTSDSLFGSSPVTAPNTSTAEAEAPTPTSPAPAPAPGLPTADETSPAVVTLPKKIDKHRGNKVKMIEAPNDLATPGNINKARRLNQQHDGLQWMSRPKQSLKQLSFNKKSLDPLLPPPSRSTTLQGESSIGTSGWDIPSKPTLNIDTAVTSPVSGGGWALQTFSDSPLVETGRQDTLMESPKSPGMPTSAIETPIEPLAEKTVIADPVDFLNTVAEENPHLFGEPAWSGDLKFITERGAMEIPVDFRNAPDQPMPLIPSQPPLKVVLSSADEVVIRNTFSHAIFSEFLAPVYSAPFQFALVGGQSPGVPSRRLSGFAKYLRDTQQLAFSTLTSHKTPMSSAIVFFPAGASALCEKWNVPEDLSTLKDSLLAGIIKYTLDNPINLNALPALKQRTRIKKPEATIRISALLALQEKLETPACRRAMSMLSTTSSTVVFFHKQKYCLFPDDHDSEMDVYTSALAFLLRVVEARRVPTKDNSARLFFIHAKGLHSLESLLKFNERRKRVELGFFTYGWCRYRSPLQSGLTNAFPLGGIATFTHRAILEDPAGVEEAIGKLQNEPFWEVYIHPFTIAILHELLNRPPTGEGNVSLNPGALSTLMQILMWKRPRPLSIMASPPTHQHERSKWVKWYIGVDQAANSTPKRTLVVCKEALLGRHPRPKPKEQPKPPSSNPTSNSEMKIDGPDNVHSRAPPSGAVAEEPRPRAGPTPQSTGGSGQNTPGGWGEATVAGWGEAPSDAAGGWAIATESSTTPQDHSSKTDQPPQPVPVQAPPEPNAKVTSTKTSSDLEMWSEHASKDQVKKLEVTVETTVLEDLKKMQLQPSLMRSYRRFVLFVDKESRCLNKQEAVEITRVKHFSFGPVSRTKQPTSTEAPPSATTTTNPMPLN